MGDETRLVPRIRFPEFTDDWEQRKLGDVVSLRGRIGFRGYKETDLVSKGQGAITFSPSDIDEMGKVSNENNKYLSWEKYDESPEIQVKVGDILFTKTASIGKIGYVRELKEKATINPQFALLTPNETTNGYFTFLSVRNDDFMKQVRGITGGSSVPTMSQEKLKELIFMSPSIEEQERIGSFFDSIDNLITLHQRKCDAYRKMKNGVAQKLFNQTVRFKKSDGTNYSDWAEYSLNDVLTEYNEKCGKNGTFEHVSLTQEGVIPKSDRYNRDFLVTHDDKQYRVTHLNDICYNPANLKFGVICRNKYGDGIFSPIYVTYKVNEKFDCVFVENYVTRSIFINKALRYQQGTVYERMSVSSSDLLSMPFIAPH